MADSFKIAELKEFYELAKAEVPLPGQGPQGSHITAPHQTYDQGVQAKAKGASSGKNIWVRQSQHPHNANRTLMVQFNSDLLQTQAPGRAEGYYDKLYQTRPGYHRPADFWELPQWQAHMAADHPNADSYVVRDPAEAKQFIQGAGYGNIAFSALDVNHARLKDMISGYNGHVAVGGAVNPKAFADMPNVRTHPTIQDFTEAQGMEHKNGYDYRHFAGTQTIPRLTLSEGCLHNCSFCTIPKKIDEKSRDEVMAQADAFANHLPAELIYINDKTFGQAKNHELLPEVYQRIKAKNPGFKGFVVQTTAAQMNKLSPEFLKAAGVTHVELGVESYNDHILKATRKPATEAIIDSAAQKLRTAGVHMIPNIMVGLPGEDAGSYAKTMGFLNKNRDIISHVNAYNLAVYQGTPLANVLAAVTPGDSDENVRTKSFHKDPSVHERFHDQLFDWATNLLNEPRGLAKAWPTEAESKANQEAHLVLQDHAMERGSEAPRGPVNPNDIPEMSNMGSLSVDPVRGTTGRIASAMRFNDKRAKRIPGTDQDYYGDRPHFHPIEPAARGGVYMNTDFVGGGGRNGPDLVSDEHFWRLLGRAAARSKPMAKASPEDPGTKDWQQHLGIAHDTLEEGRPQAKVVSDFSVKRALANKNKALWPKVFNGRPQDLPMYSTLQDDDDFSDTWDRMNGARRANLNANGVGPFPASAQWIPDEATNPAGPATPREPALNGETSGTGPYFPQRSGFEKRPRSPLGNRGAALESDRAFWQAVDRSSKLNKAWPTDKESTENEQANAVLQDHLEGHGTVIGTPGKGTKLVQPKGLKYQGPQIPAATRLAAEDANQDQHFHVALPTYPTMPADASGINGTDPKPFNPVNFYDVANDHDFWRSVGRSAASVPIITPDADVGPWSNRKHPSHPDSEWSKGNRARVAAAIPSLGKSEDEAPTELPEHLRKHPVFGGHPYGIVTAENPVTPGESALHSPNQVLEDRLKKEGLAYHPVAGNYGKDEKSFMVYGPTLHQMLALGKDFGQESVVYGANGKHQIHYTNGPNVGYYHPTKPERDINYFTKRPKNYWTEIPGGHGFFNINIDWDTKLPLDPMQKAWPKDEAENQANAVSHSVMEDALQEKGYQSKVVASPGKLLPEHQTARQMHTSEDFPANWDRARAADTANIRRQGKSAFPRQPAVQADTFYGGSRGSEKLDADFWETVGRLAGLAKAWPKDEAENTANMADHAVRMDQVEEAGPGVKVVSPQEVKPILRAKAEALNIYDLTDAGIDSNRRTAAARISNDRPSAGANEPAASTFWDRPDASGFGDPVSPSSSYDQKQDTRNALANDRSFWAALNSEWGALNKAWPTPKQSKANQEAHLVFQDHAQEQGTEVQVDPKQFKPMPIPDEMELGRISWGDKPQTPEGRTFNAFRDNFREKTKTDNQGQAEPSASEGWEHPELSGWEPDPNPSNLDTLHEQRVWHARHTGALVADRDFWRSVGGAARRGTPIVPKMQKAWPKSAEENTANAAAHPIMEDAILEQGGKKKVVPDAVSRRRLADTRSEVLYPTNSRRPNNGAQRRLWEAQDANTATRHAHGEGDITESNPDVPAGSSLADEGFYPPEFYEHANWATQQDRERAHRNDRNFWSNIFTSLPSLTKASPDDPGTKDWQAHLGVAHDMVEEGNPQAKVLATPTKQHSARDSGEIKIPVPPTLDIMNRTWNERPEDWSDRDRMDVADQNNRAETYAKLREENRDRTARGLPALTPEAEEPAYRYDRGFDSTTPNLGNGFWESVSRMAGLAKAWPTEAESKANEEAHLVFQDHAQEQGTVVRPQTVGKDLRLKQRQVTPMGADRYGVAHAQNYRQATRQGFAYPMEPGPSELTGKWDKKQPHNPVQDMLNPNRVRSGEEQWWQDLFRISDPNHKA